MAKQKYDFSGWATRANIQCSDGRIIMPDAFAHNDGQKVPLMWMHKHDDPSEVLGHALLENRGDGVYAYCTFNDTDKAQTAKKLVQHGDVVALSIYANGLKQQLSRVIHGNIREVSLVLAGANPGAFVETVLAHGEEIEDEARIFTGDQELELYHEDNDSEENHGKEEDMEDMTLSHAEGESAGKEKTVQEVIETMNEEQKTVLYAMVGKALEGDDADEDDEDDESEGGNKSMKHNVFDQNDVIKSQGLTAADQADILALAKQSNVGSLQHAMAIFGEENDNEALAHGIFEDYGQLFPEYELLKKGEPETIERDQTWVGAVLSKIHKSPFSRVRTRYADARIAELKAKGYQNKGDEKKLMAKIKMLGRQFDPQTIYIKDDMHRDDIIDVTDFSVVDYQWKMMRKILNETLAMAALVGDSRELGDPDKIQESHVMPIWHDDEMYTIHRDVDIEAARTTLQGTNTNANFSEEYIYAEAIIMAALYAREDFKGTGTPDFYTTQHLVNRMLMARDLNGRRIYDSKADLAKALNVGTIYEVEQFKGLTRTTEDGDTKKLLGLFVNLADYQFGSTKGGEITRFEDFDMDFNKQKYMLETRLSGALIRPWAAIALEEPVEAEAQG